MTVTKLSTQGRYSCLWFISLDFKRDSVICAFTLCGCFLLLLMLEPRLLRYLVQFTLFSSFFYPHLPFLLVNFPLSCCFSPPRQTLCQFALLAPYPFQEPSAAPEGVSCERASSTSLRVSWRSPQLEGQLAGYELKYQRVSGAGGGQGEEVTAPPIPAYFEQIVLEGLEKWSWYNITVAASTAVGTGPTSPTVVCRTDEDGKNVNRRLLIDDPIISQLASVGVCVCVQFPARLLVRWTSSRSTPRHFESRGARCCHGYGKARFVATRCTSAAWRVANHARYLRSKTFYWTTPR